MATRKRPICISFWISEQENELIHQKMALMGTSNMGAYIRKMAIDGYTVKLDLPQLNEMVSLLRYAGNNLNQLTRLCHQGAIRVVNLDTLLTAYRRILLAIGGDANGDRK